MLGQVVISGLLAGALYAMVALGLGLIFGVMRVLNVSHGPLLMLGAYTTFWLFQWLGLNPYLSLLVTMPLLFLVGMALQRLFVRRVVDAPELSSLLLTFGVSIAIVNLAQLAFTPFVVIVLGGAGNYPGALLGGLLLGLIEQLSSLFLTTQVNEAVAYVLLVLVLLVRPTGLLKGRA